MKPVQSNEEYVKKEDLESAYNYQKKAFDSKIEEVNIAIDQIKDIVSVRFGEDLSSNKYDKELETIKRKIKILQTDMNNQGAKLQKDFETIIDDKQEDIKQTQAKIRETGKKLQSIETNIDDANKRIDEYVENFKLVVEEIEKESKNKAPIVKHEKKLNDLDENIENLKAQINANLENIENASRKIETTADNWNTGLTNLEATVVANKEENDEAFKETKKEIHEQAQSNKKYTNKKIEEVDTRISDRVSKLDIELNEKIDNGLEGLNYTNTVSEIKKSIEKLSDIVIYNKQEGAKALQEAEKKLKRYCQNRIQELDYRGLEEDIKNKGKEIDEIQNVIKEIHQNNENIYQNNEEMKEQIQRILEIASRFEERLNRGGIQLLGKEAQRVFNKEMKALESKYDKLFREKLRAFERKIKLEEKNLQNDNEPDMDEVYYNIISYEDTLNSSKQAKTPITIPNKVPEQKQVAKTSKDFLIDEVLGKSVQEVPKEEPPKQEVKVKKNQILGNFDEET